MPFDQLAVLSQRMARFTLWLLMGILLVNAAVWLIPAWGAEFVRQGFSFSLSDEWLRVLNITPTALPWWQRLGALFLSSLPLLILAQGLLHLRALFKHYADRLYFLPQAARHLGKLGHALAFWVLANMVCEPLLGFWLTFTKEPGERMVSISFDLGSLIALFLAGGVVVIARVLQRASVLHAENQQFV